MGINFCSEAINRIIEYKPELKMNNTSRRLLSVGKRTDNNEYFDVAKEIKRSRDFNNQLCKIEKEQNKSISICNLDTGNPLKYKPFPLINKYLGNCLKNDYLYKYPDASGEEQYRSKVNRYLWNEGYSKETNVDNILFSMSTTQAFRLIIKVIARPYDVILFTAPNYGLFTFIVENTDAIVKCVELKKEDEWYINPKNVANEIDLINKELETKYKDLEYIPKVVAFFNENPHNPTGKVIGNNKKELLEELIDVCAKRNVFIIDDLIYRDISYNFNDKALPIATLKKNEDLIISLFGVSKSYGLAGVRAGFIVANEVIIQGIKDLIFQEMDSIPIIQSAILAACYNDSLKRKKDYDKYFRKLIEEYKFSFDIVNAMINGIDNVEDKKIKEKIRNKIKKLYPIEADELLKGINLIKIVDHMIPESGFFLVLDFSKIIGKKYNNIKINNMQDFAKIIYKEQNIRLLIGESMSWPIKGQAIGRITYSLPKDDLIEAFKRIHYLIEELK